MQTTSVVCSKTSVRPRLGPRLSTAAACTLQRAPSSDSPHLPFSEPLPLPRPEWGTHLSQAAPGFSKPLQPGRGEQELSLPRDRYKPDTLLPRGTLTGAGGGHHRSPYPASGRARPARGPPGTGLAWEPKSNFQPSFTASGHCPPVPRPTEEEGGAAASAASELGQAGLRPAAHPAQPTASPAPFVFLNHAASPHAPPNQIGRYSHRPMVETPRFFKPSLSPNRRPARSAQPRPPASSPQPVPTGMSVNDPLALDLARE